MLQPAIKYIHYRLIDVRNQSEVKHDLDSRLTPVKYDDLNRGESFTRQQTDFVPRHQCASPSPFRTDRNHSTRYQPTKPSLAVLNTYPNNSYQDEEDDNNSMNTLRIMKKTYQSHTLILKRILQTLPIQNIEPTMSRLLSQWGDVRSAIFQHIVATAVSCSFLAPAVNYSPDVNLITVQPHLSSA